MCWPPGVSISLPLVYGGDGCGELQLGVSAPVAIEIPLAAALSCDLRDCWVGLCGPREIPMSKWAGDSGGVGGAPRSVESMSKIITEKYQHSY